jgi:hypothetical protein
MTGDANMSPMVVYQSEEDDSIWVRPHSEFFDGRFEPIDQEVSPISLEEVEAFLTNRMYEANRTVPRQDARTADLIKKALYTIREFRDITRSVEQGVSWLNNIPDYHHLLRYLASKKKDFTESAHDTFDAVVDYIRAFAEKNPSPNLEERAAAFNQARGINEMSRVDRTMLRTMHLWLTIGRLDFTEGTPTRQQLDAQLREIDQVLNTDTYAKKEMTSDVLMGMVNNYMTASVAAIADETKSPDAECARGVLLEAFKLMGAK